MKHLNETSSKDVALYAGEHLLFNDLYKAFTNGKKFVFSTKGILLGPWWLAYNRLYVALAVFIVLLLIAIRYDMPAIALIVWPLTGLFGNTLLLRKAVRQIKKVRSSIEDKAAAEKVLTGKFKTSKFAVVGLMVIAGLSVMLKNDKLIDVTKDLTDNKHVTYKRLADKDVVTTPTFKVTVSETMTRQGIGSQYVQHQAASGAILVLVPHTYENTSNKPVSIMDFDLKLVDAKGTHYKDSMECSLAVIAATNLGKNKFENLNPNVEQSDVSCFEVSNSFNKQDWKLLVDADKNVLLPLK